MKVFELINFNSELLEKLETAGVRLKDVHYIGVHTDYMNMLQNGDKVSYIVAVLSNRYGISERTVYSLLKRFQKDCSSFTVQG